MYCPALESAPDVASLLPYSSGATMTRGAVATRCNRYVFDLETTHLYRVEAVERRVGPEGMASAPPLI